MTDLLEAEGVSVTFGGLRALDDVSIRVPGGSVVGLIGPNGAGKSTLFNVISGLQPAASGRVRLDGADITGLSPARRARLGLGRNFQNLALMAGETVLTNLLAAQHLGCGYRGSDVFRRPWRWCKAERRLRERARDAAAAFGLAGHLDEPVADLSFAAARFVELACVLVERPRLMLLDEPTTGLDPAEVRTLARVLGVEREAGTTVLLVAHDVRFVMALCDQVYVLTGGRLLFSGTPAEAQQHPAVVEAYLGRSA